MVSMARIREIAAGITEDYDYDCVALRVVAPGDAGYDAQVGESLPPSYRWEDGERTDDTLSGTCGLDISHCRAARPDRGIGYSGDRVLVIAGNAVEYGEDDGELIIPNAVVVGSIITD